MQTYSVLWVQVRKTNNCLSVVKFFLYPVKLILKYHLVVYWLVFFSIVVHGLSIPILDIAYRFAGVQPIQEDAAIINRLSVSAPVPPNSTAQGDVVIRYNRFSRPVFNSDKVMEHYDPEDYYNQKPLPKPRQSSGLPRRSISFLPQ